MAGTLSASFAIGATSPAPFAGNSALTVATLEKYAKAAGLTGAGALDVQSALSRYDRSAALAGGSNLMCTPKQIYQFFSNLFGGGSLGGGAFRSVAVASNFSGDGVMTGTAVNAFTDYTEENVTRSNYAVPTDSSFTGVWVTLIGAGGGGGAARNRNGSGGAAGGAGGGGGSFIPRTWIPREKLGATYTSQPGAQGAGAIDNTTAASNGTAGAGGAGSTFVSGSVSLTAGGGQPGPGGTTGSGPGGAGGTASATGAPATSYAGTAGGTTNATTGGGAGVDGGTPCGGAGGGAGGGVNSGGSGFAGGKGGDSNGQVGAPQGNFPGGGPAAVAGKPGAGAGGASAAGGFHGGHATGYGAGGGGGASKATGNVGGGGNGGPGYTLIEFSTAPGPAWFVDDFNRPDAPELGADWTQFFSNKIGIVSNNASLISASTSTSFGVCCNRQMSSDDMEVTLTLGTPIITSTIGIYLGMGNTGGAPGALLWLPPNTTAGSTKIYLASGYGSGPGTAKGTASTGGVGVYAAGQQFKFRRVGNVYTAYKNGVQIAGVGWTDSADELPRNAAQRYSGMYCNRYNSISQGMDSFAVVSI